MARYSILKPISLDERISICAKMLNLFGINEPLRKEAQDFLKIEPKKGVRDPFSLNDFLNFFTHKEGYDYHKIHAQILSIARKLELHGFITHAGNKGYSLGGERCFHMSFELSKIQKKGVLYLSSVLGSELIYETMKKNIAHITGKDKNEDIVGGSGILISNSIVVTCAHVITDMKSCDESLNINGKHFKILNAKAHEKIDIGFIEIENKDDILVKDLAFDNGQILEKVIALGFPPVPRSTHPVLVVQTGEVTGYMNDISKNNYMLFSAIARPGNSGGPIFSENGRVLGLVSQEVKFDGTSTFPFFAAVPTEAISTALKEIGCSIELPIDTFE